MWRLKLVIPQDLEETLIWKFQNLSIQAYSIESSNEQNNKLVLFVWLPSNKWSKKKRDGLVESLKPLAKSFGFKLDAPCWEKISHEDWSLSWQKYWEPCPIGKELLVLPAWMDLPVVFSERIIVKLDPGAAFGTGDHPTTRLCLEALQRYSVKDLRVLDIGCGSGILGLAALGLGAKEIIAVDTDPMAISSARRNAVINQVNLKNFRLSLGSIDALANELQGVKGDLLVCNILAPVIKSLAADFEQVLSSSGHVIVSGILIDQIEDITSFFASLGWQFIASNYQKNWALIHLCRSDT
ncbi:Ribosomal protein L11 methyltransferase [Prochlorococcus sp. MIT 0601]|nr:Ribosomal protein L11 methyltransferase [Prochlorococcus sp. MIT 0601]